MLDHTPSPLEDDAETSESSEYNAECVGLNAGTTDEEAKPLTYGAKNNAKAAHAHSREFLRNNQFSHFYNFQNNLADDSGALNMHGVFLHIMGDAIGSVIVIVNALACWQVDSEELNKYLDPCLSLVLVVIICFTTTPLCVSGSLAIAPR